MRESSGVTVTEQPPQGGARFSMFSHAGLTFPVTDQGPLGGVCVILLHGFPQDRSTWTGVTPLLNERGLRTVAFDQRGYAKTNTAPRRRDYSLDELAQDALAAMDAAVGPEGTAHVVGHDWGGALAWHLAGTSPRVRSATVLSTPHPAALMWSLPCSRQGLSSYYMGLFQLPRLPERLLAPRLAQFYRSSGMPPAAADRYAERFSNPADLTGPLNWYRSMPLHRTRTPRSRVPTTYVWGNKDFALGAVAAHRSAAYVRSDYRFIEIEAGHWLPETHPALVAEEILHRVDDESAD